MSMIPKTLNVVAVDNIAFVLLQIKYDHFVDRKKVKKSCQLRNSKCLINEIIMPIQKSTSFSEN